jgi:ATPase family AAA domain-containing protein 3A/B
MANKKKEEKKDKSRDYYGFDSSGLEKAAESAKYLDKSHNAKLAFDITKKKEETKQLEIQENIRKLEIQKSITENEERRKTIDYEAETYRKKADYQAQLELMRDQEKLQRQQKAMEENRRREEESVQKQEGQRRETIKQEFQMRAQLAREKIDALLSKKREDAMEKQKRAEFLIRKQAEEQRKTVKEALNTTFAAIGQGVSTFLQNPKMLFQVAIFGVALYFGVAATRSSFAVMTTFLLNKFGKPKLVRETSKIVSNNVFKLPFTYAKYLAFRATKRTEKDLMDGVILEPALETQLKSISYAVLNRKKHYAPYRNFMFYGPPGTGKTLFAKKLALQSGMDYAIMTGADVSPMGPAAVTELHNLFDWSQKKQNGMILFIDEADAFLRKRVGGDNISENLRNCINAFLYCTGTPSDKFMVVLATNTPGVLDDAIFDRIDELVLFEKPKMAERINLFYHYLVKYCQPPQTLSAKLKFFWSHPKSVITGKKLIRMEGVDSTVIEGLAKETNDFSGREIMKMVVALHDAAFALSDPVLTPDLITKMLNKFKDMHGVRKNWTKQEGDFFAKLQSKSEDK